MTINVGPITPTYITIDPTTGLVSANFTGHVHAGGVDLDQDSNPPTRSDRRVRWLRLADSSVAADLEAFDAGIANPWGNIARFRSYDQNGVIVGIQLDSFLNTHRILAQAGGLAATVFDDGGKSNFLQLDTVIRRGLHGPFDTGVLPIIAAGNEQATTITHNLNLPALIAVGQLYDGNWSGLCTWRAINNDNNNTALHIGNPSGAQANMQAGWRGYLIG